MSRHRIADNQQQAASARLDDPVLDREAAKLSALRTHELWQNAVSRLCSAPERRRAQLLRAALPVPQHTPEGLRSPAQQRGAGGRSDSNGALRKRRVLDRNRRRLPGGPQLALAGIAAREQYGVAGV